MQKLQTVRLSLFVIGTIVGVIIFAYIANRQTAVEQPVDEDLVNVQDKRFMVGKADAPVSIVEFSDILCPYCAKAHQEILPQLKKDYVETGKAYYEVRLVGNVRPDSARAGEGAYCAAEQNKFWDYLDTAFSETWNKSYSRDEGPEDVNIFSKLNIANFAEKVGLNVRPWQDCLDSGKYASILEKNQAKMQEIEAYGTPYFLFNGKGHSGAPEYNFFKAAIDAEYNKKVQQ